VLYENDCVRKDFLVEQSSKNRSPETIPIKPRAEKVKGRVM